MSAGREENLPVDPAILALSRELRKYYLPDGEGEWTGTVTADDLEALNDGTLSPPEVNRLKALIVFEMHRRGVPPQEIRKRLRLSTGRYHAILRKLFDEGIAEDQLQDIRAAERLHQEGIYQRAMEESDRCARASDRIAALSLASAVSERIIKMFGAYKEVPKEIKQTREVSVRLQVIHSRDELPPPDAPPVITVTPSLSDAAIEAVAEQTFLDAEASDAG